MDDIIEEEDKDGNKRIRFQPVPAWETPEDIEAICKAYDEIYRDEEYDSLLVIPMFILDFYVYILLRWKWKNEQTADITSFIPIRLYCWKIYQYRKMIEQSKESYEALAQSSEKLARGRK